MKQKIILVGNPNVGKSTLFNALTGSRQKTVNVPGTTVAIETGWWQVGKKVKKTTQNSCHKTGVVDTFCDAPKTDCPNPGSNAKNKNCPKNCIEVVDLPGTYSLKAASPDEEITQQSLLTHAFGINETDERVTYVCLVSLNNLASSLYLFKQIKMLNLPVVVLVTMADRIAKHNIKIDSEKISQILQAPVLLADTRDFTALDKLHDTVMHNPYYDQTGQITRVTSVDSAKSYQDLKSEYIQKITNEIDNIFSWVADVEHEIYGQKHNHPNFTDKLDKFLLHPVWGLIGFAVVLFTVFQLTAVLASPLIDLITGDLFSYLSNLIQVSNPALQSFLVDGLLASLITVLGFLPPLTILFTLLHLLESSGYMSRIAFIADKTMRAIGLDGKAVLPLIVGFGCNLPSYSATRILPNFLDRKKTAFLVPFTACNARLAVFVFLAHMFFPNYAGLVIFGLYVGSILLVILAGYILKLFYKIKNRNQPGFSQNSFILDMPMYQLPKVKNLVFSVALKLRAFLFDAGKIIIIVSLAIWLFQAIPVSGENEQFGQIENAQNSLFAKTAGVISPVFEPVGFADWHLSTALLSGFVAKEVLVGTLEQTYGMDDTNPNTTKASDNNVAVNPIMRSFKDSSNNHPYPAIIAFLVFILAYTPCMAAVVEAGRNFGKRFAFISVGFSLTLAYVLALIIFQIGRIWM